MDEKTARVRIDMGNAAFDEPGDEIARILRELADQIVGSSDAAEIVEHGGKLKLRDINGNIVGYFKVE